MLPVSDLASVPLAVMALQSAQSSTSVANATRGDGGLYLCIKNACDRYKMRVICDIYPHELRVKVDQIDSSSKERFIATFAQVLGKEAFVLDDVIVFRSVQWALYRNLYRTDSGTLTRWQIPGELSIARTDQATVSTNLPARQVFVRGAFISMNRFSTVFQDATHWGLAVEPEIGAQRIIIYGGDIAPSRVIDGLSILLNASQRVALRRTDQQKLREEAIAAGLTPDQANLVEKSKSIRDKLAGVLTDEERTSIDSGSPVTIPLGRLNQSLSKECTAYLTDLLRLAAPGLISQIDWGQLSQQRISINPLSASPYGALGAVLIGQDGSEHRF